MMKLPDNRGLFVIALIALGAWWCLRPGMNTARLYGTGAQPMIGGHYGGGQ